jgi:hypothetical protein
MRVSGHIEGLSLRLYNPKTRQWNITWANRADGTPGQPMIGEFKNVRGELTLAEAVESLWRISMGLPCARPEW